MKLTRSQTLTLIQDRIDNGIYYPGGELLGEIWSWGVYRGHRIQDLPSSYLFWHVCNNDDLSRFHLEWCLDHFAVCDWQWPWWEPPGQGEPQEHSSGHCGETHSDYYNPAPAREISEELFWHRMGRKTPGTQIL